MTYYLVKPIINGFEAALFFCADNSESLETYIKRFLNVPVSVSEITEDDFKLFGNSGFKVYAVPPILPVAEQPNNADTAILDDIVSDQ